MSLEILGEQLRKAREAKQISLAEISEETRISVKFLQAIEAGKLSILPQAYIRAFIREYARALDLDADQAIREYDAANHKNYSAAEENISHSPAARPKQAQVQKREIATLLISSRRSVAIYALLVVAAVVVVYVFNTSSDSSSQKPVSEIAFDQVVRESEAASIRIDPNPSPAPTRVATAYDSLRLEITTIDSVWLVIMIDSARRGEYLFPPQRKRTWIGKEQFLISMGNAGAASFKLNGVDLGVLGKRGAVARNIVITQSGIQQTQQ